MQLCNSDIITPVLTARLCVRACVFGLLCADLVVLHHARAWLIIPVLWWEEGQLATDAWLSYRRCWFYLSQATSA